MKLKVSVIVVSKNEEKYIVECLQSLFRQKYPLENYEIILVDADSKDRTVELAKNFPIKVIIDTYGTLGHQRNTGVFWGSGEYIAFIDADCRADMHWLSKHVNALDNSPPDVAAITGPNLINNDDPPLAKTIAYMQQTLIGSGGSPQSYLIRKKMVPVISASNCNSIYRRKVLLDFPYDNEFSWGEDAEVNFRLKQNGYTFLYNPEAMVWHHRVDTVKKLAQKMYKYGSSMADIAIKHRKPIRWYAWLPLALVIGLTLLPFTFLHNTMFILALGSLISYIIIVAGTAVQVLLKQKSLHALTATYLLPVQHISYGMGMFITILPFRRR